MRCVTKIKRLAYILSCVSFILIMNVRGVWAETTTATFLRANAYYEQKEYEQALSVYRTIDSETALLSSELAFNIGNCYFKMDDLGNALVHYKRASFLAPRDKMIAANLKYARSLVEMTVEDNRNWYVRTLDSFLLQFTRDEAIVCFLLVLMFLLLVSLLRVLYPKRKGVRTLCSVSFFGMVICFCFFFCKIYLFSTLNAAVVIRPNVQARYGPQSSEKIVFRLPAGIEVKMIGQTGDWLKIELLDGKIGWVRSENLEPIFEDFQPSETV